MESGVRFVAVDIPQVTNLTLHILAAVAEEEARLISKTDQDARTGGKARGVELGSPDNPDKAARTKGRAASRDQAVNAYRKIVGYIAMMREAGHDFYRTIAEKLNGEGHKTSKVKNIRR